MKPMNYEQQERTDTNQRSRKELNRIKTELTSLIDSEAME